MRSRGPRRRKQQGGREKLVATASRPHGPGGAAWVRLRFQDKREKASKAQKEHGTKRAGENPWPQPSSNQSRGSTNRGGGVEVVLGHARSAKGGPFLVRPHKADLTHATSTCTGEYLRFASRHWERGIRGGGHRALVRQRASAPSTASSATACSPSGSTQIPRGPFHPSAVHHPAHYGHSVSVINMGWSVHWTARNCMTLTNNSDRTEEQHTGGM